MALDVRTILLSLMTLIVLGIVVLVIYQLVYGSAHGAGFFVVLCDGSVKQIAYSVDATVYDSLGSRADGRKISLPE